MSVLAPLSGARDEARSEASGEIMKQVTPTSTDVASPFEPAAHTVDVIAPRELPPAWERAARRVAGVRVVELPARRSERRTATPAPICAFRWRDARHVLPDILAHATQHGARAVVIGSPAWHEQGAILRQGGWVLPEPRRLDDLLRWLAGTVPAPEPSRPTPARVLPTPTLLIHATLRYVVIDDQQVPLQPRELALLELLARGGSTCASTSALSHALLGGANSRQRRILAQHLHSLRSKLGRWGAHIEFTRSAGYRTWLDFEWLKLTAPANELSREHYEAAAR